MGTFLGNGYCLVKPTFTLDGSTKIFQSTWMYHNPLDLVPSFINAQWRSNWIGANRPFGANNLYVGYTLARTEVYKMSAGVLTYDLNETAVVGTLASSLGTPINTSIIVKKNTAIVGKRYRGRWMLPNFSVPEAQISQAGIISGGSVTALQALWDAGLAADYGSDLDPVLGHTSSEISPTPIVTLTVNPKIGTMPHRIRGF